MVATSGNGIVATTALDNFGRVSSLTYTLDSTVVDGFSYTYDANGNVESRSNLALNPLSETYGYDNLNRLTSFARGSLSGGTIASPTTSQSWGLDALGNQRSVTLNNGTPIIRAVSNQNQITSLSSSSTNLNYDANGNTLKDQNGQTYTYDGWNRLVSVTTPGGDTISYKYDALNRRISQTDSVSGVTTDFYYSNRGQVIEERVSGSTTTQYVMSPFYVNQMVERDTYSGGTTTRLYVEQDADYNITSLTNSSGGVIERYNYDKYGTVTIMNASGTALSGSTVAWIYGFQGGRRDPVSGLVQFQRRDLNTGTGTWFEQDPDGYVNGADTYQLEMGNPIDSVDPLGLATNPKTGAYVPDDPTTVDDLGSAVNGAEQADASIYYYNSKLAELGNQASGATWLADGKAKWEDLLKRYLDRVKELKTADRMIKRWLADPNHKNARYNQHNNSSICPAGAMPPPPPDEKRIKIYRPAYVSLLDAALSAATGKAAPGSKGLDDVPGSDGYKDHQKMNRKGQPIGNQPPPPDRETENAQGGAVVAAAQGGAAALQELVNGMNSGTVVLWDDGTNCGYYVVDEHGVVQSTEVGQSVVKSWTGVEMP